MLNDWGNGFLDWSYKNRLRGLFYGRRVRMTMGASIGFVTALMAAVVFNSGPANNEVISPLTIRIRFRSLF